MKIEYSKFNKCIYCPVELSNKISKYCWMTGAICNLNKYPWSSVSYITNDSSAAAKYTFINAI